jgi:hypothetical protein
MAGGRALKIFRSGACLSNMRMRAPVDPDALKTACFSRFNTNSRPERDGYWCLICLVF